MVEPHSVVVEDQDLDLTIVDLADNHRAVGIVVVAVDKPVDPVEPDSCPGCRAVRSVVGHSQDWDRDSVYLCIQKIFHFIRLIG